MKLSLETKPETIWSGCPCQRGVDVRVSEIELVVDAPNGY
jgi:hypothetical protein